jgi:hypothetical protein
MISIVFIFSMILIGCDGDNPPFHVLITEVSNSTLNPGDTVHIAWEYENGELSLQAVELVNVNFAGGTTMMVYGCLPEERLPTGVPPDTNCFPSEKREVDIKYMSPVVVCVVGISTDDQTAEQCVSLKTKTIKFTADMTFTVPGYPMFDGITNDQPSVSTVNFDKAFGIYTHNDGGYILNLPNDFHKKAELGCWFLGWSQSPFETEHFKFCLGDHFPILQNGFLNSPDGVSFTAENQLGREYANLVILSNMIDIRGTREDKKNFTALNPDTPENQDEIFNAFIIQIDMVEGDIKWYFSDVHIGSVWQGFITTSYLNASLDLSIITEPIDPGSFGIINDRANGLIKNVWTGLKLTTTNGDIYSLPPEVNAAITFENIPIYKDDSELYNALNPGDNSETSYIIIDW